MDLRLEASPARGSYSTGHGSAAAGVGYARRDPSSSLSIPVCPGWLWSFLWLVALTVDAWAALVP